MQSRPRVRISPYLYHDKNFQPIDKHSYAFYKEMRAVAFEAMINYPDGTKLMDIRSGVTIKRTMCADKLPRHPIMKACVNIYKPVGRAYSMHVGGRGK